MSNAFTAARRDLSYRQSICADPDTVFPLLCPVRESEWLQGWRCRMIHSESGLAEDCAVFSTVRDGEPETVWTITRHDPAARIVEFARFTPGSRICVLKIVVTPDGDGRSMVDIAYTYTGLTQAGNDFIADMADEAFIAEMKLWEDSMNHWLATGKMLDRRSR